MSVRRTTLTLALGLALLAQASLGAQVEVKLATQAPVNSSWHKALLDMGADLDPLGVP